MDGFRLGRTAGRMVVVLTAACAPGMQSPAPTPEPSDSPPGAPVGITRADGTRATYTEADVRFLQGMIAHHAQAVYMAALAPTHGASASLRLLAERIDIAQRDEIAFMQRWLRTRGETVPDPTHEMAGHAMHGGALMPGMLTDVQLRQLAAARGTEFDRLFLTFMIQHHEGALTMVAQLFASPGAAHDTELFRFASDVDADQNAEIARMGAMLAALAATPSG